MAFLFCLSASVSRMLSAEDGVDGWISNREVFLLETRREILGSRQTQKNKTQAPWQAWLSTEHSLTAFMIDIAGWGARAEAADVELVVDTSHPKASRGQRAVVFLFLGAKNVASANTVFQRQIVLRRNNSSKIGNSTGHLRRAAQVGRLSGQGILRDPFLSRLRAAKALVVRNGGHEAQRSVPTSYYVDCSG